MREWSAAERERLRELKSLFVSESKRGRTDPYWNSLHDLELYDQSFARRILWKWQKVWQELNQRSITIPSGLRVLDWGAGSGVASESFVDAGNDIREHFIWDHSPLSREFCQKKFPQAQQWRGQEFDVLLLSHVLNEQKRNSEIEALLAKAKWILWVEPGSREVSRQLSSIRDQFQDTHCAVAPCPSADHRCGVLLAGREKDWCHTFTHAPSAVHQSREWRLFARDCEIDLRRVPLSYWVAVRRDEMTAHYVNPVREYVLGASESLKGKRERVLRCGAENQVEWLDRKIASD